MKIGILGGTFDPIHSGHLAIALAAKDQFHLDKVLFIPAFIPPHKVSKRDMTPAPYRYRMVELAIRGNPAFEVSDIELNRPDVSYTVETLRDLKTKYPKAELYLIIGADSLAEMAGWREPEEIKKMAVLLAAPREGYSRDNFPKDSRVQWIEMKEYPAASTQIRINLEKARRDKDEKNLPLPVSDYIEKMKLYRSDSSCR